MIKTTELKKKYKNAADFSLKGVSLEIPDGEILGLIGLNGAGKSTFIKSVTGVIPFDAGTVIIDGIDLVQNQLGAKAKIGYVPDDHSVYENLTGREYCNFMADIYRVSLEQRTRVMDEYVGLFRLTEAFDRVISSYSHGMKQKICIIGSLLHLPKVWILDEPMVGLDPESMRQVQRVIREYKKDGHNVIFSSHHILMAQKLCDKVAVIHHGALIDFIDLAQKDAGFDLEEHFFAITGQEEPERDA